MLVFTSAFLSNKELIVHVRQLLIEELTQVNRRSFYETHYGNKRKNDWNNSPESQTVFISFGVNCGNSTFNTNAYSSISNNWWK